MPRSMFRPTLYLASLALVAATPTVLHANTYDFNISTASGPFVAAGTLAGPVDPSNSTAYDVNIITGSADGYSFLGVVDPGAGSISHPVTDMGFTFDNVLYTASGVPRVDSFGFLLYLDSPAGTSLAHVYSVPVSAKDPGGYEVDVVDPNDPGDITPFIIDTFTITPAPPPLTEVPEPSALVLLGTGLIGLTGLLRRRFTRYL